MKQYINLMRLNKPVGIWLLLLPCWVGLLLFSPINISLHEMPLREMLLFGIGAVAMRSAGCVVNDIADRHIDAQVERTKMRPLACGAISVRAALITLALLLIISLIIAVMLGWKIVALGFIWLPLIAAYPFMKRVTWWPQAFLGLTFGAGGLFASLAIAGEITNSAIAFYIGCIFWVIGYDTIYACQDMADDAQIGVKSTALLFGENVARNVLICYVVASVLTYTSFKMCNVSVAILYACLLAAAILAWQIYQLEYNDKPNYAILFKSNVWVGAIIVVGLMLEKIMAY